MSRYRAEIRVEFVLNGTKADHSTETQLTICQVTSLSMGEVFQIKIILLEEMSLREYNCTNENLAITEVVHFCIFDVLEQKSGIQCAIFMRFSYFTT